MKETIQLFKELSTYKQIEREKDGNKFFHAFLFECEDSFSLKYFSFLIAELLVCDKQSACGECPQCLKVLAGSHPDVHILGREKRFVVEDTERIIDDSILAPMNAKCKVFIIDNFQDATPQAQNKMLKILEEPPKKCYFLLCAKDVERVLPTIKSRCKKIKIVPFEMDVLKRATTLIFKKDASKNMLENSNGYLGELEKLLNEGDFQKTYNEVFEIVTKMASSKEVLRHSSQLGKDKQEFLKKLNILEGFFQKIFNILVSENAVNLDDEESSVLKSCSKQYTIEGVCNIFRRIELATKEYYSNVNPMLVADKLLLGILEERYLCKKK